MNFPWLRSSSDDANRDRSRAEGACVSCPACAREIPLVGRQRLPPEFSVLCPNCGHRTVYPAAAMHDRKPSAEPTRPGHIEFGKKSPA